MPPSTQTPLAEALASKLGPLADDLAAWARTARRSLLTRGEPLLRAGDIWQHLWWVEAGALRLFYLDRVGTESNKNFFLPGAMLWPVTPWLRAQPAAFHVEPLEDSIVWALPLDGASETARRGPAWQALEHHTVCALLDGKMQREQAFLQHSAQERYALLLAHQPDWAARIPLKHLASYLGVTDVTLSRLRGGMGLIKG
ncbi:MAG: Crp/Fnr family transcriptional regulator [Ramlibacter sp.]|nr:Crp/Fnr family transcriptional regulator [Ramlibacter sp.]